ncbi:Digeranylgeranylglycerophospholipid reductase [Candidatus Methanoperedenaceae archaeon GB37]|nr:Digeranylgeranylglycerophospholipid reductase [Candidatus Methanoperedenaceae archaeon GB37]
MEEHDVIIIGAGPAGAIAAKRCAEEGLRTLLLERKKIPRFKLCAGGISAGALAELDFRIEEDLIERECYGARVCYKDHQIEVKKRSRMAVLVSRDRFDAYLVSKAVEAGAVLHDDERATTVHQRDGCILVETSEKEYRAEVVIGADGVNSTTAKYVREPFKPDEVGLCIAADIPKENEEVDSYIEGAVEFHFGIAKMGYGWVFPKERRLSVGIGGVSTDMKDPKKRFIEFLQKRGFDTDVTTHTYPLPRGGYDREVCSDRIILVGDAAGFVDPFMGEGIKYAFISGKLAAKRVLKSYENDRFSKRALESYKSECDEAFIEHLRYGLKLTRLMNRYPEIFFTLLAENERVLSKGLEVIAGRIDYKEYLKWLIPRVPRYMLHTISSAWRNK